MLLRNYCRKAQSAIEYLLVLGAVILVVAIVLAAISSFTTIGVSDKDSSLENYSGLINPISVEEGIANYSGDGVVSLVNTSNVPLTVSKVTVGGVDALYSPMVIGEGDSNYFLINTSGGACTCSSSVTEIMCSIVVYFEGKVLALPIEKKVKLQCASSINYPQTYAAPQQCTAGQTSCSDTNYLTCNNSFWLDNGSVNGQCGYVAPCWSDTTNPHPLCNCYDLNKVRDHLSWDYVISNDINCYGTRKWGNTNGFLPIGSGSTSGKYLGTFDGAGHSISGLYMYYPVLNNPDGWVALFANNAGTIKHLNLVDVNFTNNTRVAGIACGQTGIIREVSVSGYLYGGVVMGGISCYNSGGTITNVYNNAKIYSTGGVQSYYIAGISGTNFGGTITNAYNTGDINAYVPTYGNALYMGGITGYFQSGTISNSFSIGKISGVASYPVLGGILGYKGGTITNCYWDSTLTNRSSCYSAGSTNCNLTTNNAAAYYGANGIPFTTNPGLGWSTSIWQSNASNYPTLK